MSLYFGQAQDLPLHLADSRRGNPCGCPAVDRFSKIDIAFSTRSLNGAIDV